MSRRAPSSMSQWWPHTLACHIAQSHHPRRILLEHSNAPASAGLLGRVNDAFLGSFVARTHVACLLTAQNSPAKQPPPSKGGAVDVAELESIMQNMAIRQDFVLPDAHPRPGYGKQGQPVTVIANMFQVRFNKPDLAIYHYDIEITPVVKVRAQKMPKTLASMVWNQACIDGKSRPDKMAFDNAVFDNQKNVYTINMFDLGENGKLEMTVAVPEPDKAEIDDRRRFKLTIQPAGGVGAAQKKVSVSDITKFCGRDPQILSNMEGVLTAMQAINILLRDDPMKKYTPIGARGRFFGLNDQIPISGGGVVGKGFTQSFRPTAKGAMGALQLDTAFTAFYQSGSLINLATEILGLGAGNGGGGGRGGRGGPRGGRGGGRGGRGGPPGGGGGGGPASLQEMSPQQGRRLTKLLYGKKFTLPYRKSTRQFSIKRISSAAAADIKFLMEGKDGAPDRNIGVIQYFKEQYNITITKPRLPCVVYGKNFMVPMELVHMSPFNTINFADLTPDQAADMIRVAAQKPSARLEAIKRWFVTLDYSNVPKVKAWGVEINSTPMHVQSRVLPSPKVSYGQNKSVPTNFGAWNLKNVRFAEPGNTLKSWAILSLDRYCGPQEMEGFRRMLVQSMRTYGIALANENAPCVVGRLPGVKDNLSEACKEAFMKCGRVDPQLIIVLLPRRDVEMYKQIKTVASMGLKAWVPTQCLLWSKVKNPKGQDQYFGNVALKIQSKLGGVTHNVKLSIEKDTMIVGADVTHPPPTRGLIQPSIAASVAGMNSSNNRYESNIRLQEGRLESISQLQDMMEEHLRTFQKHNGEAPKRIIFFRDGVDEGQYKKVCEHEFTSVKSAARAVGGPRYNPAVTFVICAKRHNMRFFPVREAEADRSGNLKAGTVVDVDVVHPYAFDFYLQAHAGLQGTARPAHYVVLRDENNFNADAMQKLCNDLSYTYLRATRAVSIVPVVYYANIVCAQSRNMTYNDEDYSDTATSLSGSGGKQPKDASFDPLLIAKRLKGPVKEVAWFM